MEKTRGQIFKEVIAQKKLQNSHHRQLFLHFLQDQDLFKLNAMEMFSIDYGTVMCFAGSVISFTVLIDQINSSMKSIK